MSESDPPRCSVQHTCTWNRPVVPALNSSCFTSQTTVGCCMAAESLLFNRASVLNEDATYDASSASSLSAYAQTKYYVRSKVLQKYTHLVVASQLVG